MATSSASLETSDAFPSRAGYSTSLWHSRILLPGLHTFRTSAPVLSRIAAFSFRREFGTCAPILPYQRWPSGRGKKPLASPMLPQISFTRGPNFDGLSVRFRYGPPGCSPPGLIRPRTPPQPALGLYIRASSPWVTPRTAGYDYGAKRGIAPAGLSPASTAARLAALPPVGRLGLTSPRSPVLCDATTAIWPSRGPSLCRSFPDTLRASLVCGVPAGLAVWSKRPDSARAFGHPVPSSGILVKETDGSPKFPSSPCANMPRSQTPVVP